MTKRLVAIMIITIAGGCKPISVEQPQAQDAGPIFGCYTAPGAPYISIDAAGIRFAGSGEIVPFRYELPKTGTVLRIPRDASIAGERLFF